MVPARPLQVPTLTHTSAVPHCRAGTLPTISVPLQEITDATASIAAPVPQNSQKVTAPPDALPRLVPTIVKCPPVGALAGDSPVTSGGPGAVTVNSGHEPMPAGPASTPAESHTSGLAGPDGRPAGTTTTIVSSLHLTMSAESPDPPLTGVKVTCPVADPNAEPLRVTWVPAGPLGGDSAARTGSAGAAVVVVVGGGGVVERGGALLGDVAVTGVEVAGTREVAELPLRGAPPPAQPLSKAAMSSPAKVGASLRLALLGRTKRACPALGRVPAMDRISSSGGAVR